jgi:hypothetical protein
MRYAGCGTLYLEQPHLERRKPNIVVAIQKDMFRDHFFFDKMVLGFS